MLDFSQSHIETHETAEAGSLLNHIPDLRFPASAGQSAGTGWVRSSKKNPCPVCGRTKDGDCRTKGSGADMRVICHKATGHSPGEVIKVGETEWAFTGATDDGRGGHFKVDTPRPGSAGNTVRPFVWDNPADRRANAIPAPAPMPADAPVLARADAPIQATGSPYIYGPTLRSVRTDNPDGSKKFCAQHLVGDTWILKAGPDPWPMFRESLAIQADGWPLELEGERCAEIPGAAGIVAISQPGHAHKVDQIRERYARLQGAGVPGIVYVADHDEQGEKRAQQSAEAAALAGLPLLVIKAVDIWPGLPAGGSIDDAPGTAAEQIQAIEQAAAAAHVAVLQQEAKAQAEQSKQPAPFKVLGWDTDRRQVFYRHRQTSQIASLKPYGAAELLRLASVDHWQQEHPRINDKGETVGVAWTAAASWLIEQADHADVFEPERVRGRGVWLDSGNRVVWHLGDRLEVDGTITRLVDHESRHHYGRLPALPINPAVEPLDDAHGRKILAVIKEMGWAGASDYLHVAGHAVTSNVCGALVKRPQLQSESPFGSGKTDNLENVITPLQAGIGYSSAGSTEAGIRQLVGSDSLPVTVDESEQEDGKKREALLRLVRYNFDGTEQNKGTPSGQGLRFRMRSSIALAGINAPIPNPADRSRIAVVTRKPIPGDQWAEVAARRAALITNEVGERLIRRTVTHLPALLANIATFGKVVAAMVTTGDSGRAGDTWGALLAGAHHLTSTAVISEAQALEWIRSVGWDYSHTNSDDTDRAAGAEGRQCLDHLLAHELRWRTALDPEDNRPTTDTITIRELVAMVRSNARSDAGKEAINALGRKGIKVTIDGLVVAHNAPGTQAILSSSKWSNGAHRARLLELPGAAATASPVHFPTDTSRRAVLVPWAALDGQALQPPQAAAAAPPKPAPAPAAAAAAPAPVTQYDWFPAAPPPQEWMEPFSRIAARTPRPAAYNIASELAPDGRVKPAMVSGWLKWLDALADEFAA